VSKHGKTCSDNQHVFIPFVFDIFGFLTSDVVDLLHRVQMVMHKNDISKSMNIVFKRFAFVSQKDLPTQLAVPLSFIHVINPH